MGCTLVECKNDPKWLHCRQARQCLASETDSIRDSLRHRNPKQNSFHFSCLINLNWTLNSPCHRPFHRGKAKVRNKNHKSLLRTCESMVYSTWMITMFGWLGNGAGNTNWIDSKIAESRKNIFSFFSHKTSTKIQELLVFLRTKIQMNRLLWLHNSINTYFNWNKNICLSLKTTSFSPKMNRKLVHNWGFLCFCVDCLHRWQSIFKTVQLFYRTNKFSS